MYKARVAVCSDKRDTRFFYHDNIKTARCVFVDDNNMLDIDTKEVYPVIKRNERGYLSTDLEPDKKYVISYEKYKNIDYETCKKSIDAKIDYLMEHDYNRIVSDVVKRENEYIAEKKYQSSVDKNLKEVVGDSFVEMLTAHYEKLFFKMDCDDLKKKLESAKKDVREYYDNLELMEDCNIAVRKVKQLEKKIKRHYKKS